MVIVVKEVHMRHRSFAGERLVNGTVDEVNVQPAIVFIFQEADTLDLCLQNEPLCRSFRYVVPVGKAWSLSNVLEGDQSAFHEASGHDGAVPACAAQIIQSTTQTCIHVRFETVNGKKTYTYMIC